MKKVKKKDETINLEFWDGTEPGWKALPKAMKDWSAIIQGRLVIFVNDSPRIIFSYSQPMYLHLEGNVLYAKSEAEILADFDEVIPA